MGNWRTVHLIGTCGDADVMPLGRALKVNPDYSNFHCLSDTAGLVGIGNWASTKIDRIGNLAERDYSVDDVAEKLRELVIIAPSLLLKVHCGGDYESKDVIKTITVDGGVVTVGEPEAESIGEIPAEQMNENFMRQIARQRFGGL